MKLELQITFIIASILTIIYIIYKIRKHKLNIEETIIWFIWAFLLILISCFPKITIVISKWLGFQATSNFVLCLFIFFLYIVSFLQMIKISQLQEKNKNLIQKLSLREKE